MGDDQQGAGELFEGFFHPFAGEDVEVVGRFVEQQQVDVADHQLGQLHAALLAAAQGVYDAVHVLPAEEEAGEHGEGAVAGDARQFEQFAHDGAPRVQGLVFLGVVADADPRADAQHGVVPGGLTDDVAEEGGLARAVGTQQADAVAGGEVEVDPVEEDPVAKRAGVAFQLEGDVAASGGCGEGGIDALRVQVGAVDLVHAVEGSLLVLGAPRLAGVVGHGSPALEADDHLLQPADLFLLVLVRGLLGEQVFHLLGAVPGVVARVPGELAVFDFQDGADHPVEQVAVVGDQDHGSVAVVEKVLQPVQAFEVQMVGRLVEEQDIGFFEQNFGQGDDVLLAAAQRSDGLVLPAGQAQAVEYGVDPVLDGVPAQALEFGGQVAVLVQGALLLAGVTLGVGHGLFQGFEATAQFLDIGEDAEYLLTHGALLAVFHLLGQIPDGGAGGAGDDAGGGIFDAGDQLQQGGFAAAVGADQADLLALFEFTG